MKWFIFGTCSREFRTLPEAGLTTIRNTRKLLNSTD
jgi:hypothetical protein